MPAAELMTKRTIAGGKSCSDFLNISHSCLGMSLVNEINEWTFFRFRTGIDSPLRPNVVTYGVRKEIHSRGVVVMKVSQSNGRTAALPRLITGSIAPYRFQSNELATISNT